MHKRPRFSVEEKNWPEMDGPRGVRWRTTEECFVIDAGEKNPISPV